MRSLGLRFVGHSTVRVELAGHAVLTDPVLTDRVSALTRVTPSCTAADRADVDLVLLSHLHGDHVHLPSLRLLSEHVRVVVPRGAGDWLRSKGVRRVDELAPGEVLEHGDLRVTGVRADHSGHRWGPRSTRGPQAVAMGHLIEGADRKVYAAGDTDLFPEMADLTDVDVALLPVWGWGPTLGPGHMNPERAAAAADLIKPRVAVPVHWGTLAVTGLPKVPGKHGKRMRRLLKDPPHEFANAVTGPTRVLVTQPGETVRLPGAVPGAS
ncbi:MBL fold metallo-hydrolase [Actinophytocola algeriensis]|uniref:L-ascorbate metabolism protein UlaG (Beta-lactamase superfamily) n=1 Tax=Actinophytocola algeriensis TaxID=1768010 RepID=A0A7W7QA15_9PSEU|nr:MBL fold metallo-hydrolase [Actinophytocola algeriensis]MBB4909653.1 L-ascorbate metabolism protein UlaG (beta-lactamase superfamily) [Actinophytocola algeriensis]MBE1475643.1 L-ascorbate metabolism protein UlaG (beta-lactamase superfamily) [Actinophytocola algeriensis]